MKSMQTRFNFTLSPRFAARIGLLSLLTLPLVFLSPTVVRAHWLDLKVAGAVCDVSFQAEVGADEAKKSRCN